MLRWCTLMLLVLAAGTAAARPGDDDDDEPSSLRVKGRVEARAGASDDEDWARDYLARAVIGADFAQGEWLKAQAELGLEALPNLRDAWVRARSVDTGLALQAGRFRPNWGRLDTQHRWDLPLVRRGALSKQARDLGFGDRRFGASVEFHRKHLPLKFASEIGVFEGDALPDGSRAEDLVARATIRPIKHFSLGAGFYGHGFFRPGREERWLAGLDGAFHQGPFDVMADVQAGPQLQGASVLWMYRHDGKGFWLQPGLGADLVRFPGSAGFLPYVVPTVAAGTGRLRSVFSMELGAGRLPPGSPRRVAFGATVGAAF